MINISKGQFLLNNIEVVYNDDLTLFLKKTKSLKKDIENINNYQHVYFKDASFLSMRGNINFIFSPFGKFIQVQIYLLENEREIFNTSEYKEALKKINCIEKQEYDWGSIEFTIDHWFHFPSIIVLIK